MGGVACQQHPPVAEPLGQPGVGAGQAAQQVRAVAGGRGERDVDAEHPADALPQSPPGVNGAAVSSGTPYSSGDHRRRPAGNGAYTNSPLSVR